MSSMSQEEEEERKKAASRVNGGSQRRKGRARLSRPLSQRCLCYCSGTLVRAVVILMVSVIGCMAVSMGMLIVLPFLIGFLLTQYRHDVGANITKESNDVRKYPVWWRKVSMGVGILTVYLTLLHPYISTYVLIPDAFPSDDRFQSQSDSNAVRDRASAVIAPSLFYLLCVPLFYLWVCSDKAHPKSASQLAPSSSVSTMSLSASRSNNINNNRAVAGSSSQVELHRVAASSSQQQLNGHVEHGSLARGNNNGNNNNNNKGQLQPVQEQGGEEEKETATIANHETAALWFNHVPNAHMFQRGQNDALTKLKIFSLLLEFAQVVGLVVNTPKLAWPDDSWVRRIFPAANLDLGYHDVDKVDLWINRDQPQHFNTDLHFFVPLLLIIVYLLFVAYTWFYNRDGDGVRRERLSLANKTYLPLSFKHWLPLVWLFHVGFNLLIVHNLLKALACDYRVGQTPTLQDYSQLDEANPTTLRCWTGNGKQQSQAALAWIALSIYFPVSVVVVAEFGPALYDKTSLIRFASSFEVLAMTCKAIMAGSQVFLAHWEPRGHLAVCIAATIVVVVRLLRNPPSNLTNANRWRTISFMSALAAAVASMYMLEKFDANDDVSDRWLVILGCLIAWVCIITLVSLLSKRVFMHPGLLHTYEQATFLSDRRVDVNALNGIVRQWANTFDRFVSTTYAKDILQYEYLKKLDVDDFMVLGDATTETVRHWVIRRRWDPIVWYLYQAYRHHTTSMREFQDGTHDVIEADEVMFLNDHRQDRYAYNGSSPLHFHPDFWETHVLENLRTIFAGAPEALQARANSETDILKGNASGKGDGNGNVARLETPFPVSAAPADSAAADHVKLNRFVRDLLTRMHGDMNEVGIRNVRKMTCCGASLCTVACTFDALTGREARKRRAFVPIDMVGELLQPGDQVKIARKSVVMREVMGVTKEEDVRIDVKEEDDEDDGQQKKKKKKKNRSMSDHKLANKKQRVKSVWHNDSDDEASGAAPEESDSLSSSDDDDDDDDDNDSDSNERSNQTKKKTKTASNSSLAKIGGHGGSRTTIRTDSHPDLEEQEETDSDTSEEDSDEFFANGRPEPVRNKKQRSNKGSKNPSPTSKNGRKTLQLKSKKKGSMKKQQSKTLPRSGSRTGSRDSLASSKRKSAGSNDSLARRASAKRRSSSKNLSRASSRGGSRSPSPTHKGRKLSKKNSKKGSVKRASKNKLKKSASGGSESDDMSVMTFQNEAGNMSVDSSDERRRHGRRKSSPIRRGQSGTLRKSASRNKSMMSQASLDRLSQPRSVRAKKKAGFGSTSSRSFAFNSPVFLRGQ